MNIVSRLNSLGTSVRKIAAVIKAFQPHQIATRLVAIVLIAALLSPFILTGQMLEATAAPRVMPAQPKVVMPEILLAPPQSYTFTKANYSAGETLSSSDLTGSSISGWFDTVRSWLGFSEPAPVRIVANPETETNESSPNSEAAETAPLPPTTADLSRTRLLPKNATGGTNLYSRNFSWGTGLAGFSGRGVSAGFGISYNSLVWARVGSEMVFNPDASNVTPGFQFGYPTIEPSYTDPLTGASTYLMVTPSGGRAEFRLLSGSTDTYQTADSSYVQLKVINSTTVIVSSTDGSVATYELKGASFKCNGIKDANGNFITISHDAGGKLQSVTDTLGRVINVTYNGSGLPASVTQTRSTGAFTLATFGYEAVTINTNFAGLTVTGPANGTNLNLLKQITYTDGSSTKFDYNSYGQVWKVTNYAADSSELNYSAANYSTDGNPAQTDCPRFVDLRNRAQNFNLNASNQPQETVIPITYLENQTFTIPSGAQATGTLLRVTAPDGTMSNTYYGNSGWLEGLPIVTEDWTNDSGWNRKRWSWTNYTQDDPNLGYILNPRSTESKVGDVNNVRRSTVEYYTEAGNPAIAVFGLTKEVKVYDADQTTVLKRSVSNYNLDAAYLARRIIGLPSESLLYDGSNVLLSRTTYNYDEGTFSEPGQSISPIQQDGTNYGASFVVGRGNMTSTTRWDVNAPANPAQAVTARIKYNTAGSPVASVDPLGREVKTVYTDSFDDNQNRNTFAYATAIIDPAGQTSTVKYNYDLGVNVFATSPVTTGNTSGKTSSRIYDTFGRLQRETTNNTGAYTRYEYATNGVQTRMISTVTDANANNTADVGDEIITETITDGAGRAIRSRSELPGANKWSASLIEYDVMGRVKRASVPGEISEVNNDWVRSGDDAGTNWLWTAKNYDWKGRVVQEFNTDGTDKLYSYEGCGCAGGQVTTLSGEQLDANGARRRQKIYEDILGRTYKTESLNWDGTVYSTVKTFFNGRDQASLVRQYAGTDASTSFQDTVMTYDGHGRVASEHRPEQDANTATVFTYNLDDTLNVKTDARGATSTFTYDNRKLVTQISYAMAGTTNPPPAVTNNYSPIGSLEAVDTANAKVWGWTMDPDSPSTSNAVHFYIDGTFVGSSTANQPRADINQSTSQPGNHGFNFRIPNQYLNGYQHSITAFGQDNGTNAQAQLGAAKTFTIGTPPPPERPVIANAQAQSQNQIDVYWNQPPAYENVTSFNLRINGGQVVTGITYLSYPVTGLTHSTQYTFEVQAVSANGTSAWSLPVSATTSAPPPPPAPSIASVSQNTNNSCLDLTLNASTGATSYNIKLLSSGATVSVTSLNYQWCGLQAGTYYDFQAQAVNQYGASAWSAVAGGTTSAPPPNNSSPVGYFDSISYTGTNYVVRGWSFDPDQPSVSNTVHVSIAGAVYGVNANLPRPDVNSAYGITGNHGFEFELPAQYDGSSQQYTVYIFGIDLGTNANVQLTNSPQTFGTLPPQPCYGQEPLQCPFGQEWDASICGCREGGLQMRSAGGGNRNQQQSLAKNSKPAKKDKSGGGEFSLMRAPYDPENPYYPYDPDPPEPGPGAGTSPIGNFEGIDQAGRFAGGWSFDPDNSSASNIIHFYIDGPAGSGTFLGSTTANLARPDVNSAYSITGQHGFRFQIPTQYQNGQQHTIYAYGLDTGPNGATHLSASPKTFTFNYTPAPPPTNTVVTFTYDELGNRKTMTDASGTVTYEYNQLSQLTAETRSYTGENLPDAPLPGNSFKLQYAYSISGQLKSLTDPFGQQINYGHDKAGRLQSVTGSTAFGGVTTYAQNPHYRAWGALQNLTYGNGVQMNIGFNSRLQAANYTLVGGGASAGSNLVQKAYQFYTDGAVRYVQDQLDARFDRFQTYDQLGRVTEGKSGAEARGQSVAQNQLTQNLPYRQSYQYDAFDNMTQRNNLHWGIDNWYNQSNNLTYAYQNNRQIGADYDADGRMLVPNTTSDYAESKYDAAGHLTRLVNLSQSDIYRFYDGDGKEAKRETRRWIDNSYAPAPPYGHWTQEKSFYIRSSVLGGEIISEAGTTGRKLKTYVKANGTTLATQNVFANAAQALTFEHTDAAGMSYRSTAANGEVNEYEGTEMSPVELDPKGANVGTTTPYIEELNTSEPPPEITGDFMLYDDSPTDRTGRKIGCVADKIRLPDFGQCRGEMESARLGGVFGLLEHAARMSALPPVKIGEWWRTYTTTPPDTGDVIQVGVENTYKLSDVYADNNSWSAMSNIISWEVKVNKTSDQTPQQKCDYKLARIFGDDDAVMGTATEPAMKKWNGIDKPVEGKTVFLEPERVRNRGGESPEKGTAHLFANKDGRGEDKVNAYTPPGYYGIPKGYPSEGEDGGMGAEKQNFLRVYYKPGSLTKYGYDGGLIINFTHIGPTTKNRTPILPKGVAPNSEGSIPVGVIGGYGNIVSVGGNSGGYGYYVHIHMIFNTWDGKIASTPSTKTRIDPRQVFCKEFGF